MNREKPKYYSVLFNEVPRTKLDSDDPEWDKSKCWHCQEFPRIIRDPDVIVWCMRCYRLLAKKHDGTYIRTDNMVPIAKDLKNTPENREFFAKSAKFDKGHSIEKGRDE